MSILSKDWRYIVVPAGTGSTLSSQGAVSVVEYPAGEYVGSALPVIQNYPAEPTTTLAIDIRVATAVEVSFLEDSLFGWAAEPMKTTLFTQKLYQDWGKPLYVWPDGNYITSWYGVSGLGFYVFVGHDSTNYPTQEVLI